MNPGFDHSQIDNYLKGKMIPVQEEAFELRLQSDRVLLAETKAYARIHDLSLPDKALFQQVAEKKEIVEKSNAEGKGFDWQWLLLLLLILAIAYYFLAM